MHRHDRSVPAKRPVGAHLSANRVRVAGAPAWTASVRPLILLNGPPGSGKSTLAQLFADEHPLALNLDIDRVRSLIGCWREQPEQSGLHARAIALVAAREHLRSGKDVIIPQHVGRLPFIEQVERRAADVCATFYEVALLDDWDAALARFVERTRSAADPAHLEAQEMLDRCGGLTELSAMYDRTLGVISARPGTVVLTVRAATRYRLQ
jgi:predicted kinase